MTATNQMTGAEALVRMLQLHEVDIVFGLCGDTSLPFYDAFQRLGQGMRHILTRDERSAAYMADGYARVTGKVGVCEGPSGGGATYILPGVIEANESSVPILAITTDVSVSGRGRFTLTEIDQEALFRPLAKWNRVLDRAADLPRTLRAAFKHMTTGRSGAAHLGLPFDVQRETVDEAEIWADASYGRFPSRRVGPDPDAVERFAAVLAKAERPLFICGGGVVLSGAEAELTALAETLDAAVATTISGQGSISERHALAVGVVGSNGGTPETRAIVNRSDLVVFVGCRAGSVTTERWQYPRPGAAKIAHIDVDPTTIGVNFRTDVDLVGDARLCLAALRSALGRLPKRDTGARAAVAACRAAKTERFRSLAASDETPIRPERLIADLQAVMPEDAIVVADPGTPCPYLSAWYEFARPGRHFISNRAHGALGYSMSAAVGAYYGQPASRVVSVMGDGSFGFTCGELETIVRQRVPVVFVVVSNAVYGWIKAGQKTQYAKRYFSVDFSEGNHARIAEAFGVKAWRVSDPAELKPALRAALELNAPALVDVVCQPLHEAAAPVSEWIA